MENNNVLDKIILKTGESLYGIVDYVNKKHIYFFDFTNTSDTNITLAAITWKSATTTKRFSVFATINFPGVELPVVNLIHNNNIEYSSIDISMSPKEKQSRQSFKYGRN